MNYLHPYVIMIPPWIAMKTIAILKWSWNPLDDDTNYRTRDRLRAPALLALPPPLARTALRPLACPLELLPCWFAPRRCMSCPAASAMTPEDRVDMEIRACETLKRGQRRWGLVAKFTVMSTVADVAVVLEYVLRRHQQPWTEHWYLTHNTDPQSHVGTTLDAQLSSRITAPVTFFF